MSFAVHASHLYVQPTNPKLAENAADVRKSTNVKSSQRQQYNPTETENSNNTFISQSQVASFNLAVRETNTAIEDFY
mgnify:CR=1 FL=1|tara:strand:+ start:829 stop:1059 length:231 start_codon:yes stop_codon:yes gene_type:complete